MGAVYFIATSSAVKIGFSENVPARMDALQTANSEKLELLGAIHGDAKLERFLQKKLEDHRLNREWFKKNDVVLSFVVAVLDSYPQADERTMSVKPKARFIPDESNKIRISLPHQVDQQIDALDVVLKRIERANDVIQRVLDARQIERDHKLEKFTLVSKEFPDGVIPDGFAASAADVLSLTENALKCLRDANDALGDPAPESALAIAKANNFVEVAEQKIGSIFGPYKLLKPRSAQMEAV